MMEASDGFKVVCEAGGLVVKFAGGSRHNQVVVRLERTARGEWQTDWPLAHSKSTYSTFEEVFEAVLYVYG